MLSAVAGPGNDATATYDHHDYRFPVAARDDGKSHDHKRFCFTRSERVI